MSLPNGIWKANLNGTELPLTIEIPNPQGVFLGRLLGTDIKGFWDEGSQKITFNLTISFEGGVPSIATFNGFLLRTPPTAAPELDVTATLTGYFQMNPSSVPFAAVATSRRNVFGWFAQLVEVH